MSELSTIRERIERASSFFEKLDSVVLTTFNLHDQFLEEQALKVILGVDAATAAARNAGIHERLAETACTVFYDPTVAQGVSGKFRYVARPVPLRGRLFHPKLVVMAGRSADGTAWVYLAVSSGNLSLSGWGRNAECFGETWIHTRKQQTCGCLDEFLKWLEGCAPLGEHKGDMDAVTVVRATLAGLPDRRRFRDRNEEPWSGSLDAQFYSSVVDEQGWPTFLKMGRRRRPDELWVYSPYWSNVAEGVREFGARSTALIPALRRDRKAMGLPKVEQDALDGSVEVYGNAQERQDDRYWHMKAYRVVHGSKCYTAVGSCNFTEAGLAGARGNVEAMLVFEGEELDWPEDEEEPVLPASEEALAEEDAPSPVPVAIVVAYDWRSRSWRWFLEADSSQGAFRLKLPGRRDAIAVTPGRDECQGEPPPRAAQFSVIYREGGDDCVFQGPVIELNLDHSRRVYGKPLSANDILDSWRGRVPSGDLRGGGDGDGDGDGDDGETHVPAAFDAVNLYDLYRSTRGLRTRLAELESQPRAQRALLVGRPDSVVALANLADGGDAPVVRYLVLRELSSIVADYRNGLRDDDLVDRVRQMMQRAKRETRDRLTDELEGDSDKARKMLKWFDKRLASLDGAER